MATFSNEWEYLIHLLSSALRNEKPGEKPDNISFEQLFSLARYHSVANMAFYSIERLENRPEKELFAKWTEVRDKEIMKDIIQSTEQEQLFSALSASGVRFIPLKGSVLKTLYPQSDFRTMSDIDLYIDDADTEKSKAVMLSLGYEINRLEHGVHDVYYKKPVMNVEIHRDLFGEGGQEFSPVFGELWSKCTADGMRYDLENDFFLTYVIAHGIKHYTLGGTGIRTFMDIHVYLQQKGADLNRIYSLCEKAGQRELCEDFVKLADVWFGSGEYTDKLREMAEYVIRGGTYGTFENQMEQGIKKQGKLKFILSRIFPSVNYAREQFPVLRRMPFLLPVFWVVRWFKFFTVNRKENAAKIKALTKKGTDR